MAPQAQQQQYQKDERVLCFHHELLYEAKIMDSRLSDPSDKKSNVQYLVHYKGWKNTWDDWVFEARLRKLTDENKELAQNLKKDLDAQRKPMTTKATTMASKKKAAGSDLSSGRGSEERNSSVPAMGRGQKRGRDYELEKEDDFHARPKVSIPLPDHLKAILVDDWENVTKNLSLVPLPSKTPVNVIMDTYYEEERGKRLAGSAEMDMLEEVVAGMKDYFNRCLGKILLYRFEREQYSEVRNQWIAGTGDFKGKENVEPGDVYGAEHLARLFSAMPELIAQTNMDTQAVNRLKEELTKMVNWLTKNANRYFTAEYETADSEYIEKARGV